MWADVEVPDGVDVLSQPDPTPRSPTAWGSSLQVNDDDSAAPSSQLFPQMAADGDRVVVVWQDTRHGHDNVYAAVSTDGGVTWSSEVQVCDNPAGAVVEMLPDVDVPPRSGHRRGDGVRRMAGARVGYGSLEDGRIMLARFDDAMVRVDVDDFRVDDADGAGQVASGGDARSASAGIRLVVWVDERDAGPRISVFEHLYAAKGRGRRGHDDRPSLDFSRKSRAVVRQKTVDPLGASNSPTNGRRRSRTPTARGSRLARFPAVQLGRLLELQPERLALLPPANSRGRLGRVRALEQSSRRWRTTTLPGN